MGTQTNSKKYAKVSKKDKYDDDDDEEEEYYDDDAEEEYEEESETSSERRRRRKREKKKNRKKKGPTMSSMNAPKPMQTSMERKKKRKSKNNDDAPVEIELERHSKKDKKNKKREKNKEVDQEIIDYIAANLSSSGKYNQFNKILQIGRINREKIKKNPKLLSRIVENGIASGDASLIGSKQIVKRAVKLIKNNNPLFDEI